MQYRLDLQLSAAEGAIIRVLGMIERRGFTATAIQAERASDGLWQLTVIVESQRPGTTLAHQLEKIHDCVTVAVNVLDAADKPGIAA